MLLSQNLRKRHRFCQMGSKSDALDAFWRGLEEPGRSSGGVLEKCCSRLPLAYECEWENGSWRRFWGSWEVLGGLGRVVGLPMPICKKMQGFGPQVGLHVGPEKCVF